MTDEEYQKIYEKRDDDLIYNVLKWNKPTPMTAAEIKRDLITKRGILSLTLKRIKASLRRLVLDEDAHSDDGSVYRIPGKRR